MFYVYILESLSNGSFYVGQTNDLVVRVKKHNKGEVRSTRQKIPWRLVYSEEYPTRSQAMLREREIKSRKKRKFLEGLILSKSSAVPSRS
jgi:putative endonuclease